jgi:hypothetical protein
MGTTPPVLPSPDLLYCPGHSHRQRHPVIAADRTLGHAWADGRRTRERRMDAMPLVLPSPVRLPARG